MSTPDNNELLDLYAEAVRLRYGLEPEGCGEAWFAWNKTNLLPGMQDFVLPDDEEAA